FRFLAGGAGTVGGGFGQGGAGGGVGGRRKAAGGPGRNGGGCLDGHQCPLGGRAGGGVEEAGEVDGDHRDAVVAHRAQQLGEVRGDLGAAPDAQDRIDHQVRGPHQVGQPRLVQVFELVDGPVGLGEGGGAAIVDGVGDGDGFDVHAVTSQGRGGVQTVAAVGTGPGEQQHALRRRGGGIGTARGGSRSIGVRRAGHCV